MNLEKLCGEGLGKGHSRKKPREVERVGQIDRACLLTTGFLIWDPEDWEDRVLLPATGEDVMKPLPNERG